MDSRRDEQRLLHCEGPQWAAVAYVIFEDEPERRTAAKRDEAPRIVVNIANLPELSQRQYYWTGAQVACKTRL